MAFPTFRKARMQHALRITYEDQMKFGDGMLEVHLEKVLANPQVLAKAIRLAMLETIIPKLREAWLLGLTKAVNMEVISGGEHTTGREKIISNSRMYPTSESEVLHKIYERMRDAHVRGSPRTYQKAVQDLVKHQDAYLKSLQRLTNGNEKSSHYLSSGLFRSRALDVMSEFVGDPKIRMNSEGQFSVGIGDLGHLEGIKTPSATEYVLKRGRTNSKYDILWRHLEFGTGVYSDVQRESSKWNEGFTSGEWYYGRNRASARLLLHGSRGVHSLKAIGVTEAHPDFVLALEMYLTKALTPGSLK